MSKNWESDTLENLLDALIDYRGKTPKKVNNGIPLVTAKIVKDGFIQPYTEFIAESDYDNWMTRGLPQVGDVVLTTEAPLGKFAPSACCTVNSVRNDTSITSVRSYRQLYVVR